MSHDSRAIVPIGQHGVVASVTDGINHASFTKDSRHILSASEDGSIRFWDIETGAELAKYCAFEDGTWAVIAPDGRYDSSNNGECPHLRWTVGLTSYPITRFKERFYTPGMLATLLGKSVHNPDYVIKFVRTDYQMY